MYPLPMHDFVMSYNGHLENTGSLCHEDLSYVDISHLTISKSHLLTVLKSHMESLEAIVYLTNHPSGYFTRKRWVYLRIAEN